MGSINRTAIATVCYMVMKLKKWGEKLEDFIAAHNLEVENIGREPTYESRGNKTIIDVTLTRNLRPTVKNWRVDRNYNASDHNTILYGVVCEKVNIPKQWKWHKADWDKFGNLMSKFKSTLPNNIKDEDCEKELKEMYRSINYAMNCSIPKSKPKIVDKSNPWWTPELKQARNNVSKLYKHQNKSPTPANIALYKKAHQAYKKDCLKARKDSWRNFQTKIDDIQSMNTYRKIIEGNTKGTLGTLTKPDGSTTDPGGDTLDYLLQVYFKTGTPIQNTKFEKRTINKRDVLSWECEWITVEKIKGFFSNFKSKKSPGTNNLHPIILKYLPDKFIEKLAYFYKVLILLNFTPTKWKECKLVFIPKPGKESYKDPK